MTLVKVRLMHPRLSLAPSAAWASWFGRGSLQPPHDAHKGGHRCEDACLIALHSNKSQGCGEGERNQEEGHNLDDGAPHRHVQPQLKAVVEEVHVLLEALAQLVEEACLLLPLRGALR
eukprot:CAMPEP_0204589232 /NCGR_PEP_ID=MMETSP0661-20131031/49083_1 /ASSEMBLY_ACC=CAM_ASM_000606 /TAXON_ID=109239 /ORGANISM="Alexandrium margalefi, Strain AMGDE01CS-322" /LENGTH=117 /DNA_ID=CAMNT_0051599139 /DNA_START=16 /DNA_END=367 /DNA_ORIENTATION=+